MNPKHVAVLMGGLSAEREVSKLSGDSVVKALVELGYKVSIVDPDIDLADRLRQIKPDVVFNALHGTYGEDGAIPGLLEILGIPYTHSGILASAIAMDKKKTKDILYHYGVRSPNSITIKIDELMAAQNLGKEIFPKPYVMKPLQQGSSLGVYIVTAEKDFKLSRQDWQYGEDVLIEEYIPGKELSVAVFQGKAFGVLELRPQKGFYDFKAKYTDGVTQHILPAEISQDVYKKAMEYAEIAHNTLGCRTISRSDFRFDAAKGVNGLYFLEINTHSGFTNLSLVPEMALYNGITFNDMVEVLVNEAKCDLVPFRDSRLQVNHADSKADEVQYKLQA